LKQLGLLSRQADIRRVTGASSVNLRQAQEKLPGGSTWIAITQSVACLPIGIAAPTIEFSRRRKGRKRRPLDEGPLSPTRSEQPKSSPRCPPNSKV
jgi:hypothetical protein